ncbi:MAG: TlpA family protein disulfide reductase [Rubrivivax sp.]|nr:TlpA family protein disulfide reductase [Rubrivivax sp.]
MKRLTRRRLLATAAALPVAAPAALAAPAAPGSTVQWPEVTLLDGSRFGAEQARGRALVVVFWSITCPFCRRHNQHVDKLHRAAAGRALTVLGAARDRDPAAVRRHMLSQGHAFAVTLDWRPLAEALSQRNVIPLTVTVDRQGRLKQVIPGEMFEEDVLGLLELAG